MYENQIKKAQPGSEPKSMYQELAEKIGNDLLTAGYNPDEIGRIVRYLRDYLNGQLILMAESNARAGEDLYRSAKEITEIANNI